MKTNDLYSGDLAIERITTPGDDFGSYDIVFPNGNGQPKMTQGFGTCVLLMVFGDKNTWQNSLARTNAEKFTSDFPDIVERGVVSEDTKNDGVAALNKALKPLKDIGAVKSIEVTGEILSVYGIAWEIKIIRLDGTTERHTFTSNTRRNKWDLNWKYYEE